MTAFTEPCLAAPLLDPEVEHTDKNVMEAMEKLRYPVMATYKFDGVRGLRLNGTLLSRRFKPIPNKELAKASTVMPGGFDVEIFHYDLTYNEIQSIVMSRVHPRWNEMVFCVLDRFFPDRPLLGYAQRIEEICETVFHLDSKFVVEPIIRYCYNAKQLFDFEQEVIEEHGEGICFRTPNSPYKMGRSTLEEQYLVKLSRYVRDEAVIIGFEEQMENGNPDAWNEVGKMNRSQAQSGLYGKNTLGKLVCTNTKGQTIKVGTGVGLTQKLRKEIWENQSKYLGRTFTYKHKPCGQKILPRSPILVGWRKDGE